jgi:hypothetical protein
MQHALEVVFGPRVAYGVKVSMNMNGSKLNGAQRLRNSSGRNGSSKLPLNHALRVKSAEYWLKLGESAFALVELQKLPAEAQKHPKAVRVHLAVMHALRETNDFSAQA